MKLSALQNFLVVATELNISKAAQKLFITQQSLSESIARLESEYHVRFFDRTPRLRLTYAGERMKEFAEKTLLLERQFRNEMADVSQENIGSLAVGIRNSYNRMLLSTQLMPVFVERHPNIMLKVTYGNSRDLSKKLLLGEIDLCIGSSRILTDPNFVSCSVLQDFYSIIIPENILNSYFHLSAEQAERGEMPDFNYLREAPLIMISGDSQTRAAGDHLLAQYKVIPPNVILECSGPDQGLLGAASGLGVCFAPEQIFYSFLSTTKTIYRLFSFRFETSIANPHSIICYHRMRPLSKAGQDFIDLTIGNMQEFASLHKKEQEKTC